MRHPDDFPPYRPLSPKRAVTVPAEQSRNSSLLWLFLATAVTLLLMAVPFASVVTFPIRMFVTFIHEGSHALAALLSGFYVIRMTIHWDGSGLTLTSGQNMFVASAGYLGTILFGVFLLYQAQRRDRASMLLVGSGILVLLLTILFVNGQASWLMVLPLALAAMLMLGSLRLNLPMPARWGMFGAGGLLLLLLAVVCVTTGTLYSWGAGLGIGISLVALGIFTKPHWGQFIVNFLSVQCCLDALSDLKTLFFISTLPHVQSDAVNMARMTGIPAFIWASLWLSSGVLLLGVTLWMIFRRSVHKGTGSAPAAR
ncbi:MAG: M50 family metallopeptidase [Acidobacteriota bacterium]